MTTGAMPLPEHVNMTPWWLVLLQGIAALIMGLLLLAAPFGTVVFVVQFLGWYWLVSGIFEIVGVFLDSANWGWKLAAGVLGILAGLAVVNHPLWSAVLLPTTLVWVMGFFGIAIGISMLVQAFQGGGVGTGVLGALSILLGLLLLIHPFAGALALPWVYAVFAIAGGIASIFTAFRMK